MTKLEDLLELVARDALAASLQDVSPCDSAVKIEEVCDSYSDGFQSLKLCCKNLEEQSASPEVTWASLLCIVGPDLWPTPRSCLVALQSNIELEAVFKDLDNQYTSLVASCLDSNDFKSLQEEDTIKYMRELISKNVPRTAMVGRLAACRPRPEVWKSMGLDSLKQALAQVETKLNQFWTTNRHLVEDVDDVHDIISPLLQKKSILSRAALNHLGAVKDLATTLPPRKYEHFAI